MKTWMKLVAVAVVLGLAGASSPAEAAGAAKAGARKRGKNADALRGKIVSVANTGKDGAVKLVVHSGGRKNPHDVTVETNADTKVTVDGRDVKASDLKPGERVTITPASGTAKTIVATVRAGRAPAKGEGKAARADAKRKPAAKA